MPVTRFESINLSVAVLLQRFTADTLRHAVTLTFDHMKLTCDRLTLDICSISAVTLSNSLPNLNEIKRSAAEFIAISIFDLMSLSDV